MSTTFQKARTFIYRNARPVDLARFQFHFEHGSKDAVLTALGAYQNEDGGFGHALEPDCWNPHSSPIQTWAATEILLEIGHDAAAHPIAQGILRYLASGKDFTGRFWANCVQSNNDHPHAPWWNAERDSTCKHDYNPTACLAGFILRFAEPDSELRKLGQRIANEALENFMTRNVEDMHTLGCFVRLYEYAGIGDMERLKQQVKQCITIKNTQWEHGYVCKPSQFFNTCDSVFYADNQNIADYECEHIIKTQQDDGAWNIPWSWESYPEAWAVSKNWWRGDVAVKNLLYLKGIGNNV